VLKHFLYSLLIANLLAAHCFASEGDGSAPVSHSSNSLAAYEQHVREVAQKTAADERARKEQERIAKARTVGKAVEGQSSFRIFKYKKDGATIFTDNMPYKTKYEVIIYNSCYACSLSSTVDWYKTRLYLTEFSDTISLAAQAYQVDIGFIRAIIHAESAFNPLARSRKGAMGLMQLMPGTARDMGVADTTNPEQNIKGGVKYLAGLLQKFNGNETLAAAAYNAGAGAVTRHGGIPPYEETQTYVKRVKILAERYKNQKQLAAN